jgi:DNA-binding NtrC family response regulator
MLGEGPSLRQETRPELRFVGMSEAAEEVREFVRTVAPLDCAVLLRGESGVGKDYLAQIVHEASRSKGNLVDVDCGAITESLSDTELFGHTRGAFTDAREETPGFLGMANNGTLFFNEVANMSLPLQAKFLSILDRKPFRQVGGSKLIPFTARIIAATNANLEHEVKTGRFRQDLYHRLNEVTCSIPSLRDRRDDILPLAEHFLQEAIGATKQLTEEAAELLRTGYHWPGNARELGKAIRRAHIMSRAETALGPEYFRPFFTTFETRSRFPTFEEAQRDYLMQVLQRHGGVQQDAAKEAGITPRVMSYTIRTFGLQDFVSALRLRAH